MTGWRREKMLVMRIVRGYNNYLLSAIEIAGGGSDDE